MGVSVEEASAAFARTAAGTRVLAAVSGGADSMAMADALRIEAGRTGITLEIAHYNHRWRADSDIDEQVVRSWCARHNIAFFAGRERDPASGHSESRARARRYAFLETTARNRAAAWVTTAHTRDDQAETVLLQRARGCGLRGSAGIAPRRGRVARPLLDVARADTRLWCAVHRVPFRDDPTNADTRFARNRVRHEVLPGMLRRDPHAIDRLITEARAARRRLDGVRATTDPILRSGFTRRGPLCSIAVSALSGLTPEQCQVLFADAIDSFLAPGREPSRRHYQTLYRLSRTGHRVGDGVSLPGIDVRREHDVLVFLPHGVAHVAPDAVELQIPGCARFAGRFEIVAEVRAGGGEDRTGHRPPHASARGDDPAPWNDTRPDTRDAARPGTWCAARPETWDDVYGGPPRESGGALLRGVAYLDLDSLHPPLSVRPPRAGDRIRPIGLGGSKKLSDLLAQERVPRHERAFVPVVADAQEIVWVAGLATGENARVRETTQHVVRLTARDAR